MVQRFKVGMKAAHHQESPSFAGIKGTLGPTYSASLTSFDYTQSLDSSSFNVQSSTLCLHTLQQHPLDKLSTRPTRRLHRIFSTARFAPNGPAWPFGCNNFSAAFTLWPTTMSRHRTAFTLWPTPCPGPPAVQPRSVHILRW
jgi:hypothetical protein